MYVTVTEKHSVEVVSRVYQWKRNLAITVMTETRKANGHVVVDADSNHEESDLGFTISTATDADREEIAKFLHRSFFPDEPLHMAAGNVEGPPMEYMHSLRHLDEGFTLLAKSPNGDIVGAAINAASKKERKDCPLESFAKVIKVLKTVVAEGEEIMGPHTEGILELRILAVHKDWRQRGVARVLLQRTAQSAARELRILCTSQYSARLAESVGMTRVYSRAYNTILDDDTGLPLVIPPLPHTHVNTYVLRKQ